MELDPENGRGLRGDVQVGPCAQAHQGEEGVEEKSRELGEAGEEIRKKAAEPIGSPPPPPKGKGMPR